MCIILVHPLILTGTVIVAVLTSAAVTSTSTAVPTVLLAGKATNTRFQILKALKLLQDVHRHDPLFLGKLGLLLLPELTAAEPSTLLLLLSLVKTRICLGPLMLRHLPTLGRACTVVVHNEGATCTACRKAGCRSEQAKGEIERLVRCIVVHTHLGVRTVSNRTANNGGHFWLRLRKGK
jgi:hypothetical protein